MTPAHMLLALAGIAGLGFSFYRVLVNDRVKKPRQLDAKRNVRSSSGKP